VELPSAKTIPDKPDGDPVPLNSKSASYLAWAWNTDFNCATGPGLITSYTGTPTPYGAGYESMLRMLARSPKR
jgi:hypothetical protein